MKASNYFYLAVIFTLSIFSCGKEEIEPITSKEKKINTHSQEITEDDLAFRNAICIAGGEVVTVVKRGNPDLNYYNSENYRVIWTVGNHQIIGNSTSTDCLCGKLIQVTVIDLRNDSRASMSYGLIECIEDDNQ